MLVGHFGVALGLKRFVPQMNLVWLAIAALFLDLLLWALVLSGIENVLIPEQYEELHYLFFEFPFSHSLVSIGLFTLIAGLMGYLFWRGRSRSRAGIVIALAVLSHIVLDLLVHPEQIPIAGSASGKIGLGLWNQIVLATLFEFVILLAGLILYYRRSDSDGRAGRYGPAILFLVLSAVSLGGQLFGGRPPSETAIAGSSIIILVLTIALAGWLDSKRHPAKHLR